MSDVSTLQRQLLGLEDILNQMMLKVDSEVSINSVADKQSYKNQYSPIVTHKDMPYNKKVPPIEDGESQKLCDI